MTGPEVENALSANLILVSGTVIVCGEGRAQLTVGWVTTYRDCAKVNTFRLRLLTTVHRTDNLTQFEIADEFKCGILLTVTHGVWLHAACYCCYTCYIIFRKQWQKTIANLDRNHATVPLWATFPWTHLQLECFQTLDSRRWSIRKCTSIQLSLLSLLLAEWLRSVCNMYSRIHDDKDFSLHYAKSVLKSM